MDILNRRPLFTCCAVFMLASLAGIPLGIMGKCILGGMTLAGTILYACRQIKSKQNTRRAVLAVVAGILACLALLESALTFQSPARTRLQTLEHQVVQVEAVITDRRGSGGNMTAYTLSLESVNGRSADGLALLTCAYTATLRPGNEITLEATLIPLSEAAGDGYDATALLGDGYVIGLLSESGDPLAVTRPDSSLLRVKAGNLRRALGARLHLLTGDEAHGLPSALLLGDKSPLSDTIRRDFGRAGVSHLLAISGLHLTLLFGLLELILRFLGIPKKVRAVLLGACGVGYLMVLGFPPSATRAAIMLGVTYLSYMCSETVDPLTSLGLAGAVILAATPYAVLDAGFWMSFLATLGLVTLVPPLTEWMTRPTVKDQTRPMLWRVIRLDLLKFAAALAVGLIAVSFTLSVVAAVIGEMGILSPVSTILLTPFCAAILLLSLAALPLAGTAAGVMLGQAVTYISASMAELTTWMAQPSWAVVSLRHPAVVPIAVAMLAVTLVLLVVRLPERRRFLVALPMVIGWIAVGGVLTIHAGLTGDQVDVTYLQPSAVSESLVMVSGSQGMICDLSNGSLSAMTAAAREAKYRGATELSVLMLTHYHSRTSGALATIFDRETVRALWMPEPRDEEAYFLMLACLEKAEASGVPVFLYENGEALQVFGEGQLILETMSLARSDQPVLLVSLDLTTRHGSRERLVYCGGSVFESDLNIRAAEMISEAQAVIFGHHGPLLRAPYGEGLDLTQAEIIVFSAHGDAAAWFAPDVLPAGIPVWVGQKRLTLPTD